MTNIVETVVTAPVQLSPDAIEIINLVASPVGFFVAIFILVILVFK